MLRSDWSYDLIDQSEHYFETYPKPSFENIRSTIISCFDYVIEAAQGGDPRTPIPYDPG